MSLESKDELIDALRRQVADLEKRIVELERRAKEKEMPSTSPAYITEGSFGKISSYPLQNFVYKTTILRGQANGKKLEHEFDLYCEVYDTTNTPIDPKCPPNDVEFISPRPRQLFDPISRTVQLPGRVYRTPASSSWDVFDHPTMSLDLIPSVPSLVAQAYKSEFFTQELARNSGDLIIRLIRLYLGRELPTHIQELQPGLRSDLALDVGRYTQLSKALSLEGIATLPRLGEVASAMGSILAHLHFCVGIDGMDVELVLGGNGDDGLQCYIIDYNQCQRWLVAQPLDHLGSGKLTATDGESLSEGAIRLARRIANCEHYYPKPTQNLYGSFKDGYELTVSSLIGDRQWDNACKSEEPDEAFDTDAEAMIAAGEAFLAEYERVGLETAERKARSEERKVDE